ncbi:MAG: hypothetical protein R3Y28_01570 [Candidatus Gastranaerophilales bacterium]
MQENFSKNGEILIKAIGQVICNERKKLNKTIYLISAESSMSKSTWRDVELGICKDIKLITLCKIAEGLDMNAHQLLEKVYSQLDVNFSLTGFN